MNNNITELVFILDRSGSMSGLVDDTVGGFNAMIEEQKGKEGRCLVTTVLFDNEAQMLHDRVPLEDVRPMTRGDYRVGGCTALLDALGETIRHVAGIHRYARPEDVPEKTVFIITTDGMENASRRYGSEEVRRRIEHEKEKYGWEFLFLAANIDAVETAARYGITRDRAANFRADSRGSRVLYETVNRAVSEMRFSAAPLSADWAAPLDEDMKKRGK